MKTYELDFLEDALKEWKKLDSTVRDQFARKLAERLTTPHVQSARLPGMRERSEVYERAAKRLR